MVDFEISKENFELMKDNVTVNENIYIYIVKLGIVSGSYKITQVYGKKINIILWLNQ